MCEKVAVPKWIWCLVGNVVGGDRDGRDGDAKGGTKQFSPGAKVYCYPAQWGDGYDRIMVLGKPRRGKGLIRVIIPRSKVENFRLQKVFSTSVIGRMYHVPEGGVWYYPWGDSDSDRMGIKEMLAWLNLSDEESARWRCTSNLELLTLESRIEGCDQGSASLRVERARRRDGFYGGAWYGFARLGDEDERELGVLDWYGIWPDVIPDLSEPLFGDVAHLSYGLCHAGIHLWPKHVEAPANYGGPGFEWRLTIGRDEKSFTCSGINAYPSALPSVYRLLAAWGMPPVWDSGENAPCVFLKSG